MLSFKDICSSADHARLIETGVVTAEQLDAIVPSGNPNDRAAGAVLTPWLANATISRALSLYLTGSVHRCDNTELYAKGLLYSFLAGRIEQEHLAAAYPAYPQPINVPITYIDVNATTAEILGDVIQRGEIVLLLGVDVNAAEMEYVYYLALGGRRIGPGAVPSISAMAIHWPPIAFSILHRGGNAPAPPQAGAINSEGMWRFMQRLATSRNERDFFAAGAYEAAFLIDSRLEKAHDGAVVPQDGANRPDTSGNGNLIILNGPEDFPEGTADYQWYTLVTPTLESFGRMEMPISRDYNFLHRLLRITRTEDETFLKDYVCFGVTSVADRLLHASILSGFTSIFMTTTLQAYGVNGSVIQLAAMRNVACPPMYNQLAGEFAFTINPTGLSGDAAPNIFVLTVNQIDRYVGGVLPLSTMSTRSWNHPAAGWNFLGPFGLTSPSHPPRFGSPLVLLPWLDMFPVEWGILDHEAQADFRDEVALQGDVATRGWYAYFGDPGYKRAMTSEVPYAQRPYGALAVNAIAQSMQRFIPAGAPNVSYQAFVWDNTGRLAPIPVAADPNPPVWNNNLRVFEPCTIMPWDWTAQRNYSPCFLEANVPANWIETLSAMKIDNAKACYFGFVPARKVVAATPPSTACPSAGLKRRMGVQLGPGTSQDPLIPPPAKVPTGPSISSQAATAGPVDTVSPNS